MTTPPAGNPFAAFDPTHARRRRSRAARTWVGIRADITGHGTSAINFAMRCMCRGRVRLSRRDADEAFWAWAAVETLRHTMRMVAHPALVQQNRPQRTGQTVDQFVR